jgi:hypothetical protein
MNRDCLPLDHTGRSSAVIYTFVEQTRRHGADPFPFFEWVFEKLMHSPAPEEHDSFVETQYPTLLTNDPMHWPDFRGPAHLMQELTTATPHTEMFGGAERWTIRFSMSVIGDRKHSSNFC